MDLFSFCSRFCRWLGKILSKFGTISLSDSLAPGIKLAEKDSVSKLISWAWKESQENFI